MGVTITWAQTHEFLRRLGEANSEWAGLPCPVKDNPMSIHPRYPCAGFFNENHDQEGYGEEHMHVCRNTDINENVAFINSWFSPRYGCQIEIWKIDGKYRVNYGRKTNATMLLNTCGASFGWDLNAEIRAMSKLQDLIPDHLFRMYVLTGMFMETSKRSGVIYLFRRLRPIIAMKESHGFSSSFLGFPKEMMILCTLCGHPIGYYRGSWAGAMVPTDDVIASLLLMRADEHFLWRSYAQHEAGEPESGI